MGMAMQMHACRLAAAEDTAVIVEGAMTADAVKPRRTGLQRETTAAGARTKMPMTQRDIPQSVSIVSQQRMEDQQLQTLGEVMTNTLGISEAADLDRISYYSRAGLKLTTIWLTVFQRIFESRWNWAMR